MRYTISPNGYYYKEYKNGKKMRVSKKTFDKHNKVLQKGGGREWIHELYNYDEFKKGDYKKCDSIFSKLYNVYYVSKDVFEPLSRNLNNDLSHGTEFYINILYNITSLIYYCHVSIKINDEPFYKNKEDNDIFTHLIKEIKPKILQEKLKDINEIMKKKVLYTEKHVVTVWSPSYTSNPHKVYNKQAINQLVKDLEPAFKEKLTQLTPISGHLYFNEISNNIPIPVKPAAAPVAAVKPADAKAITNKMKDQLEGKYVIFENDIITKLPKGDKGKMFNKNTMIYISDRLFLHFQNKQVVNVNSDYKKKLEGKYVFSKKGVITNVSNVEKGVLTPFSQTKHLKITCGVLRKLT